MRLGRSFERSVGVGAIQIMMMVLRDDPVIEVFESPLSPPDWIEIGDIRDRCFCFCDDVGQRFIGEVVSSRASSHG